MLRYAEAVVDMYTKVSAQTSVPPRPLFEFNFPIHTKH